VVSDKIRGGMGGPGEILPSPSNLPRPQSAGPEGSNFESLLDNVIKQPAKLPTTTGPESPGLKFSQHALDRMASRGIAFKPEDLLKLNDAVEKAAKKGSKESLVLMGDNALIVSIKNKTVVTAMDREAMKENVFTNIDSTVIL
jgi:flagellar operon protein